ncbi:hypothetical protein [Streptomyces sp. NPDC003730]
MRTRHRIAAAVAGAALATSAGFAAAPTASAYAPAVRCESVVTGAAASALLAGLGLQVPTNLAAVGINCVAAGHGADNTINGVQYFDVEVLAVALTHIAIGVSP